ncbi:hypothetical protein Scep_016598 [Stephania cephalantha]|uniref:Uncharacterized protein n=1 Tax=Stephania cephalantha TaxID=152367 RepID=A0AAP0INH1_9MAGN
MLHNEEIAAESPRSFLQHLPHVYRTIELEDEHVIRKFRGGNPFDRIPDNR